MRQYYAATGNEGTYGASAAENALRTTFALVSCTGSGSEAAIVAAEDRAFKAFGSILRDGNTLVDGEGRPLNLGAKCQVNGKYVLSAPAFLELFDDRVGTQEAFDKKLQPLYLAIRGKKQASLLLKGSFQQFLYEGIGATAGGSDALAIRTLVATLGVKLNPCNDDKDAAFRLDKQHAMRCKNGNYVAKGGTAAYSAVMKTRRLWQCDRGRRLQPRMQSRRVILPSLWAEPVSKALP